MGADFTTVLNYVDSPFFKLFSENVNRKSNHIFYMGILLELQGLQQIAEALHILKKQGHTNICGQAKWKRCLPFITACLCKFTSA